MNVIKDIVPNGGEGADALLDAPLLQPRHAERAAARLAFLLAVEVGQCCIERIDGSQLSRGVHVGGAFSLVS